MIADIQVSLARSLDDWRAVRIVGLVEGHGARDHLDEHGSGMAMPAALPTREERDGLRGYGQTRFGLDFDFPAIRALSLDFEWLLSGKAVEHRRRPRSHGESRSGGSHQTRRRGLVGLLTTGEEQGESQGAEKRDEQATRSGVMECRRGHRDPPR